MKTTTIKTYEQAAHKFFSEMLHVEATPRSISDALINACITRKWRRDTFIKYRAALKYHQGKNGFKKAVEKLANTTYPLTKKIERISGKVVWVDNDNGAAADKKKRCKRISLEDASKLIEEAQKDSRREAGELAAAAIYVCWVTGCRPAELPYIKIRDTGGIAEICIRGAKQDEIEVPAGDGKIVTTRGLDRTMTVATPEMVDELKNAIPLLNQLQRDDEIDQAAELSKLKRNVSRISASVFSRRKPENRPTLYTLRHQMASNLKKLHQEDPITMSKKCMSYLMGHQSSFSIQRYGDSRNGNSGSVMVMPAITEAEISTLVRDSGQLKKLANSYSEKLIRADAEAINFSDFGRTHPR